MFVADMHTTPNQQEKDAFIDNLHRFLKYMNKYHPIKDADRTYSSIFHKIDEYH